MDLLDGKFCRVEKDDEYGKGSDDPAHGLLRRSEEYYGENGGIDRDSGGILPEVHLSDISSLNFMEQATGVSGGGKTEKYVGHLDRSPSLQTDMSQFSRMPERSGEESEGTENADECNYESSMFESPNAELEQPVDFEKNGRLWTPPEPEDGEDDTETSVLDDEDDDDGVGCGLPRCTGSFSNNEYRTKDRSSEELRKAMRTVVDGHFRALVAQLLKGEDVPVGEENDRESWLEIVTSLSWQAATLVKPDTSKGGGMDPGGYVKVKCVACGHRCESEVIKGVVCKKKLAHRRMTPMYKNPRLLLLGGALEYQRVSNQLSSLDTLLQQEMDHLKMTVAKIEVYCPNVLLVEKTISRYAQEYLLAKEISFVLNIKKPLLERIARCTGAQIVPSLDNLTAPKVGHCELFHVDKFVEEHGSAGQPGKKLLKTLMFFEGCPKPLGCTVLLKGANGDELKKVKRVVQYAVFAAYHLALETSFLADEGATLPELPFRSPITVPLPDKQSSLDRSISTISGFNIPVQGHTDRGDMHVQNTQNNGMPTLLNNPSNLIGGRSIPPFTTVGVTSSLSGSLLQVRSHSSSGIAHLPQTTTGFNPLSASAASTESAGVQEQDIYSASERFPPPSVTSGFVSGLSSSIKKALEVVPYVESSLYRAVNYAGFEDNKLNTSVTDGGSTMSAATGVPLEYQWMREEIPKEVQWENQGKAVGLLKSNFFWDNKMTGCKNNENANWEEQESSKEDFPPSPSNQQSILVSLSTRCVWKGTVCERAHLFRIKYYGSFDKPLGRFLRDDLFDQNYRCRSCDSPTEAHVHCYTHRQGSLTIAVKRLTESILPGERDGKIWMWHVCLKCARKNRVPQATRRVVMSDAAWGLSFGKFLELSFSNHAAASRVANCGHSLHRDCLRFYGFARMVACFRYASIHVHSVHLPPPKLEFNDPNQQEWLRKEASEVADKGELFFAEAFDSLRQVGEKIASSGSFYAGVKVPESRRQIVELEGMLQKEKTEFEESLQRAFTNDWQPGQPVADILELNRLRQRLIFESYIWDQRLRYLDSSLRAKRSVVGSDNSLPEELNAPLLKENSNSTLSEKIVESHGTEKVGISASQSMNSMVQRNSCAVNGNDRHSSSSSDNLQFEAVPVNNTPITTDGPLQPAGMLDSSLVGCFTKIENMDERLYKAAKPADIGNRGSQLVEHVQTNVKDSMRDSSTGEEAIIYQANGKENQEYSTSSPSSENKYVGTAANQDRPGILEGDLGVRRTLSEGNLPILADLSDTLDAAWTGEGHSVIAETVHVTLQGQEVGLAAPAREFTGQDANLASKNYSDSVKISPVPSAVKTESADVSNPQDKCGPELLAVSAPTSPVKSFDVLEDFGTWIGAPFSNLYKAYSKGSQGSLFGSSPRFDSLGGYTPTFVSSVSQLGGQGGARLLLPPGVNNTVIFIYDDEPTSIIAYALTSHEYHIHVSDKAADKYREKDRDKEKETGDSSVLDPAVSHPLQSLDGSLELAEILSKERNLGSDDGFIAGSKGTGVIDPFLYTKAMHVKISFSDENPSGKVKYMVTCYYARQFDALRRKCCPTEMDFIRSLCRCKKWGAQGGKSNVFFAKTLDDRFIVKQVTKTELESFIKFAPEYFKYLSDSLSTGSPTCLAKILGIYQVTAKHAKGGKEVRMDLVVMENLMFGRNITRLYDLKGSARSRYNADSTGTNKVLLDQNLLEAMPTSPIFVGNKAKRILERAVWNDTSFLASVDVMDYSLLVGVDEERHELVLGIIDFMRQYTWDKHLETWVKASGILGGPKNTSPTIISPKQYKKRFRKAMSTYFLMVPDHWSPPTITPSTSQLDICEDRFPISTQEDVGE